MVNSLWNAPEKVTSTPKGSSSSTLKKIVAAAIALTLSGEPAEAKTYNKQEFPTEMVANIPWTVSPMTENVEQSSIPNYINQAQAAVRKYYPQYEEYFNKIFTRANRLSISSQNLVNKKIDENFDLFEEELTSEKDKITTILLVLEKVISNQNELSKSIKNKDLIEIATEISNDINQQARADRDQARADCDQARADRDQARADRDQIIQETNLIKRRTNKVNEIINYINSNEINKETMENIVNKIEEYFTLFEIKDVKEEQWLQKMINHYINYTKQINRTPSNLWKRFIEEYIKIKNK